MAEPRRKILVAVGTRPEAVKLAPVIRALRAANWAEVRVLATAQHREMLDQALAFFGIEPDIDLDLMQPGQGLAELSARMMTAVDAVLAAEQPDLVLVQGDTTTVMVVGLGCYYRRIAVGHVEAGLRTHDKWAPFPEEMNRALVGRLADLHFAPTEAAAQHLRAEAVPADRIHMVGNTVVDALLWGCQNLPEAVPVARPGRRLVLVTTHRRENHGAPLREICAALLELCASHPVDVLLPVHPNPQVGAVLNEMLASNEAIQLVAPLDYPAFLAAMRAADLILTDSGGVQEEAPSLDKPILVLRETTERPEGVSAGTARLVGTDRELILREARRLLDDPEAYTDMAARPNPYGDGHATERILAVLEQR